MKNQSGTIKTNPELYRVVMGGSGGYRRLPGGSDHFSLQTHRHCIIIYISQPSSWPLTILFRRWERGGWSNSAGAGGRRPQTLLSHKVVSFNLDIIIIIMIYSYVYPKLYCRTRLVIMLTSEDLRDVNYFDNVENIRIEKSYILNIAKGTTDPRVEFIWTSSYTNLDKFQFQNLDYALTSKSQPNISIST